MVIQRRDKEKKDLVLVDVELKTDGIIGSGTFGKVTKVMLGVEIYALKAFTISSNDLLHVTTIREIKALRSINSQYVLRIEHIIVNNYTVFLLFPYYDYDLYRLIGSENFTLQDIRQIFWQVLMGVKAVHDNGFLHRDLKSANILLNRRISEEGEVLSVNKSGYRESIESRPGSVADGAMYDACICDFGMSRKQSKEMSPEVVTLWYRPPELLLGSSLYTKAIDIWSLGCILLEFFNKKPIFKMNTEVDALYMITELCGSINEQSLPGCTAMPLYGKFNLKEGKRQILQTFSLHSPEAVDLADRMLRLNPNERLNIDDCLQHSFFTGN